jgi:hypothetical protein
MFGATTLYREVVPAQGWPEWSVELCEVTDWPGHDGRYIRLAGDDTCPECGNGFAVPLARARELWRTLGEAIAHGEQGLKQGGDPLGDSLADMLRLKYGATIIDVTPESLRLPS